MARKYNNTLRLGRKAYADLKRHAEQLDKPERKAGKSRAERRAIAREQTLPANRTCHCGRVVLVSRGWVVIKRQSICECLACYRKRKDSQRAFKQMSSMFKEFGKGKK